MEDCGPVQSLRGRSPGGWSPGRGGHEGSRSPVPLSHVHQKSLIFAATLKASIRRHDEDKEEISRKSCEADQMNEELTGPIPRLQTERASLRSANSQLENLRRRSLKLHPAGTDDIKDR